MYFTVVAMTQRCARVIRGRQGQIVLDVPAVAGASICRHIGCGQSREYSRWRELGLFWGGIYDEVLGYGGEAVHGYDVCIQIEDLQRK
jgi:hypothetical protein